MALWYCPVSVMSEARCKPQSHKCERSAILPRRSRKKKKFCGHGGLKNLCDLLEAHA